jgi:molybdenum cofactor cytidylyltransferase
MSNVGIVLLAAGNSSRMGSVKQLLEFKGKPLVRIAAEAACNCGCAPVIVVLGAHAREIRPVLRNLPLEIAVNESWSNGIGTSIKAGLDVLGNRRVNGAIMFLADQPFVPATTLRHLAELQARTGSPIVASRYSGTVGVPALFSRDLFPKLLELAPHEGCKRVLLDCPQNTFLIDCPEAEVDIDTPADYLMAARRAEMPLHIVSSEVGSR